MDEKDQTIKTYAQYLKEEKRVSLLFGKALFFGEIKYLVLTFLSTVVGVSLVIIFSTLAVISLD